VLLLGSSVMLRSWRALVTEEIGFDPAGVLAATLLLPEALWTDAPSSGVGADETAGTPSIRAPFDELQATLDRVRGRLSTLPTVEAVGTARYVPLTGTYGHWSPVRIEGWEDRAWSELPYATSANWVDAGYFRALDIRPLRGRLFSETDVALGAPPVAVVSESFAARFWPNENALGRRFYAHGPHRAADGTLATGAYLVTVVGIVPSQREQALRETNVTAFLPLDPSVMTATPSHRRVAFLIRGTTTAGLVSPVRDILRDAFPDRPLEMLEPLESRAHVWVRDTAFAASLTSAFGAYGFLLALVGVGGLVAVQVSRRTQEIGIRMVLGARPAQIRYLLGRETVSAVGLGVVAGVAGAAFLSGATRHWIYEIQPLDLPSFLGVPLAFALAAGLATMGVSARAAHLQLRDALDEQ
jgi:putative ABC transport system permease protein